MPRKFFQDAATGAVVAVTVISKAPLNPKGVRKQVAIGMRWANPQKINRRHFMRVEREHKGKPVEVRRELVDHLTILVQREFLRGRRSVEEQYRLAAAERARKSAEGDLRKESG